MPDPINSKRKTMLDYIDRDKIKPIFKKQLVARGPNLVKSKSEKKVVLE